MAQVRKVADAGMQTVFDSAHGSSAGACAAAYFWSDQIDAGRAIYFEDISNRRVVNPYRFWSRPCMVDTDYIADAIIGKKRAINAENLIQYFYPISKIALKFSMRSVRPSEYPEYVRLA